jgi:hypothetical protein
MEQLHCHPAAFRGERFARMFFTGKDCNDHAQPPSGIFEGIVTHVFHDDGENYWKVLYIKDQTTEEFDVHDMTHFVINQYVTPSIWNGSDRAKRRIPPIDQPVDDEQDDPGSHLLSSPDGKDDPYERILVRNPKTNKMVPPTDKLRIDIHNKRDVTWNEIHTGKRNAKIIVSEQGDNFQRVCDKLGIAQHKRKLYDMWLGKYYGEDASPPPQGALGQTYLSPWKGERRRHPLAAGSKFPAPQGPSWMQYVQEFERQSKKAHNPGVNDRQSGKIAQPEAETLKKLTSKAYLIGYHRARDQYNATKDIKYVMQASPCKNYEDFLDLEVTEQGLPSNGQGMEGRDDQARQQVH